MPSGSRCACARRPGSRNRGPEPEPGPAAHEQDVRDTSWLARPRRLRGLGLLGGLTLLVLRRVVAGHMDIGLVAQIPEADILEPLLFGGDEIVQHLAAPPLEGERQR